MNILCFGEPLIRFATVAHERLDEARTMEISYSGAESVVAVTLAQFGEQVSFASKLSSNRLGTNAIMNLARYGVDTSRITRSNHRMGLYYTERGRSISPPWSPTTAPTRPWQTPSARTLTGTACSTASRSSSSRA